MNKIKKMETLLNQYFSTSYDDYYLHHIAMTLIMMYILDQVDPHYYSIHFQMLVVTAINQCKLDNPAIIYKLRNLNDAIQRVKQSIKK